MPHKPLLSTVIVGAALATTTPAFADFTPTEALERYFDSAEAFGSTVSVELKEGLAGTVRWTGITVTDTKSGSTTTIDWMEASPIDEDTVKVLFGPKLAVQGRDLDGADAISLEMEMIDHQTIMSETGSLTNMEFTGERLHLFTTTSDAEMPLSMEMIFEDLSGNYAIDGETNASGAAKTGAVSVTYGIDEDGMSLSSTTQLASTEVSFDADLPQSGEFDGYLTGAQNATMTYAFNDATSQTSFQGEDGSSGSIASVIALSAGTLTVQDGAFALLGEAQDISYKVQPPMPGFPEMAATMKSATANMSLTVGAAGELAPMAMAMTLEDLELGESVWAMFDPSGAIPRTPATLRLDLGAEALWLTDDFEAAMTNGEPPLMPQSLVLRDLYLTLGGASVSANGEGILSAQTGLPSGTAQVELKGVLTLIQTLSEIGIVPVPQAMMAQGMLPQFTRPGGDGSDHMISDIEAMPDGSIFVNGTRIK